MKDTIITASFKKRELFFLALSLVLAMLFNVYSIFKFSQNWKELYTSLGVVLIVAAIFYVILLLLRLLVAGIIKLFKLVTRRK
ncbi:MAG: hypothetical protein JXJ22_15850 [Bacteroidales bacterium]|nr:hypothetical protein [Bacteroidales bacterium]